MDSGTCSSSTRRRFSDTLDDGFPFLLFVRFVVVRLVVVLLVVVVSVGSYMMSNSATEIDSDEWQLLKGVFYYRYISEEFCI